MTEAHSLFTINPRINKKFILQLAQSLVTTDDTKTKLAILLACKQIIPSMDSDLVIILFKVLFFLWLII